jgi:hypothetical protein
VRRIKHTINIEHTQAQCQILSIDMRATVNSENILVRPGTIEAKVPEQSILRFQVVLLLDIFCTFCISLCYTRKIYPKEKVNKFAAQN